MRLVTFNREFTDAPATTEAKRAYEERNRERRAADKRQWLIDNREKHLAAQRRYRRKLRAA